MRACVLTGFKELFREVDGHEGYYVPDLDLLSDYCMVNNGNHTYAHTHSLTHSFSTSLPPSLPPSLPLQMLVANYNEQFVHSFFEPGHFDLDIKR